MKLSIVVPVMGQIHEVKGVLGTIFYNATTDYETIILDNSILPDSNYEQFVSIYLKPKNLKYIKNPDNLGMVKTLQQGYLESSGDVIVFLHSDLFIYDKGWDELVLREFEQRPEVGLAGFFGQKGIWPDGGRGDTMSNMLEAEIHGRRSTVSEYIATVDGFSIICRREMLDKKGGFDLDYKFHHLYDKAIGLDSLHRGYKNLFIPIRVHHWSGKTSNAPEYQSWINNQMKSATGDMDTMRENMRIFNNKWGECLPFMVDMAGVPNRSIIKK